MQDQKAAIEWRDRDVPVSTRFDDPYYSLENGLEESRHVFLAGNALPERFRDDFHIAELGFGTGLNLLMAFASWRDSGVKGRLRYTTFEAFPLSRDEMKRAQAAFGVPEKLVNELDALWGNTCFNLPDLQFEMVTGDARRTLPLWKGQADAWFLDGFSPAKNPELWEETLIHQVGVHTAPSGTAATYTAAGHVRRALQAAGFEVTRVPGFGRKRHMTRALRT